MSSEAVTEIGGETKSAWAYRIIFLSEKIAFNTFYCPYCNVPLFSRNINTEDAIVRPPHFYVRGKKHIGDCNGEAIFAENTQKHPAKNKTLPREMNFPDEFVQRPPPRDRLEPVRSPLKQPQPIPLEEINRRRVSAGKSGRSRATSYLLQAFVEAKNIVLQHAYDVYTKTSQLEERNEAIKDALLAMPLKLDDNTNYQYGFQTLAYPNRARRIYQGAAKVTFIEGCYVLVGQSTQFNLKKEIVFSITIPRNLLMDRAPRYHREIIKLLSDSLDAGVQVKFHCFGLATQISDSDVEVHITSLDFVYITPTYVKKNVAAK